MTQTSKKLPEFIGINLEDPRLLRYLTWIEAFIGNNQEKSALAFTMVLLGYSDEIITKTLGLTEKELKFIQDLL